MSKKLLVAGVLAVFAVAPLSARAADPLSSDPSVGSGSRSGNLIIGSADYPESQLLATIYGQALMAKGIKVTFKLNIGSREVHWPAMLDGSIDVIPEYAGAMLGYLDKNATVSSSQDVVKALGEALPKKIAMLNYSQAENSNVLAVTEATAKKYGLKTMADLAPVAANLVLGGSPEFKVRKEGVVGLKEVYGLNFKSYKTLDVGGPLTFSALKNAQVQVANVFTTDPAIKQNRLTLLKDPKNLFKAQNVVPLLIKAKLNDHVTGALNAVSAALTTDDLVLMNGRLANHEGYDTVAASWLKKNGLDH